MGNGNGRGRGRGRLTIGVVVRLGKAVGGVEVSKSALIGVVERSRSLFGDEAFLQWLEWSGLGGRLFGVGIGTSGRTVGLHTTSAVDEATLSLDGSFLLTNGGSGPVGLLHGCEKEGCERCRRAKTRSNRASQTRDEMDLIGRRSDRRPLVGSPRRMQPSLAGDGRRSGRPWM